MTTMMIHCSENTTMEIYWLRTDRQSLKQLYQPWGQTRCSTINQDQELKVSDLKNHQVEGNFGVNSVEALYYNSTIGHPNLAITHLVMVWMTWRWKMEKMSQWRPSSPRRTVRRLWWGNILRTLLWEQGWDSLHHRDRLPTPVCWGTFRLQNFKGS